MAILEAYELAKASGTRQILQPLSFTLEAGRIAGLFGPNGAGKSTLLRLLAGQTRPTGGVVAVGGLPLNGTPPRTVAWCPQRPTLLPWLRVEQMIDWYAYFYDGFDLVHAEFVCEQLGIDPNQRIKALGEAQTHILATALTLCRKASLYLLDDPFAGIDLAMCARLQALIKASLRQDCAILLATHTMAETESLYDEALFLQAGGLAGHTTLAAVQAEGLSLTAYYKRAVGK